MRLLKRHKFFLIFLGVLVFCSVMVIRQFLVNQWEHVDLREDFILLHGENHPKAMERLYQMLIQELPGLPDRALLADDQRLALLLGSTNLPPTDLLCKYHVSVQNELQSRANQRVARALKRAGSD